MELAERQGLFGGEFLNLLWANMKPEVMVYLAEFEGC
jgi:hypothetical protein